MTKPLLRSTLSSASFAEQQFPRTSQAKWIGLIDLLLKEATDNGIDPGMVKIWKDTRATAAIEMPDFDLDDLDSLTAESAAA